MATQCHQPLLFAEQLPSSNETRSGQNGESLPGGITQVEILLGVKVTGTDQSRRH